MRPFCGTIASPLVVAYAIAGTVMRDLTTEPLGRGIDANGQARDVYLSEIWPSSDEIHPFMQYALDGAVFRKNYAQLTRTGDLWSTIEGAQAQTYHWPKSTYI